MKFFSYYRVSSKGQEENGVSLEAQQEANLKFAEENKLTIVKEFREVQSASKGNRKIFPQMINELKKSRDVRGIIFHDVDRSARSLKDWSIIGELPDSGYKIFFSREGMGLDGRGNRLTADIKAVVASDFIRNLSQETKKGMQKRLEQGYCVTGHGRLGYIAKGNGIMDIDPQSAPLIKECFELYATERYTLRSLAEHMYSKGLRSKYGKEILWSKIPRILKSKFYIGLMEVKEKIYNGNHKAIIDINTFNKVQEVLKRRHSPNTRKHEYEFRLILKCGECGNTLRSMTAKKKYHYYYCHNKGCSFNKSTAEKEVRKFVLEKLRSIKFTKIQVEEMTKKLAEMKTSKTLVLKDRKTAIKLRTENIRAKLNKLADIYLDSNVVDDIFKFKKQDLLIQLKLAEDDLKNSSSHNDQEISNNEKLLELLSNPVIAYKKADTHNKKRLLETLIGNIKIYTNSIQSN